MTWRIVGRTLAIRKASECSAILKNALQSLAAIRASDTCAVVERKRKHSVGVSHVFGLVFLIEQTVFGSRRPDLQSKLHVLAFQWTSIARENPTVISDA